MRTVLSIPENHIYLLTQVVDENSLSVLLCLGYGSRKRVVEGKGDRERRGKINST